MTKHNPDIKAHLQQRLSRKFGGIEVFSKEHSDYIGKFSRLVESMKSGDEGMREKNAAVQLEDVVGGFLEFVRERNVFLTEEESKKLQAITGSGYEPLVKKRMAEDFIHEVKQRYERESLLQLQEKKRDEEVKKLRFSRFRFFDWFRLTGFSLSFGTITPFSHRIKGKILHDCHKRLKKMTDNLIPFLEKNLNEKFYLLSNKEYNVLLEVQKVAETVRDLNQISWKDCYTAREVSGNIDLLAKHYIGMIKNAEAAERGIKNLIKKEKESHGIQGALKFLMDKPLKNGKVARLSRIDYLNKTILGLILTYFTVRKGIVVETLNQVIFLSDYDGSVDDSKKLLTESAKTRNTENLEREETEQYSLENRLQELKKINTSYIEHGKSIEEKIARLEAKTQFRAWLEENNNRPLLRIKRLTDAFIRYFAEPIFPGDDIPLSYDSREYDNFFEAHPPLLERCRELTLERLDLIGSKLKEFLKPEMPQGIESDYFLENLVEKGTLPGDGGVNYSFQMKVLQQISGSVYNIANSIFEITRNYENNKEVVSQRIEQNYDFYQNALFTRSRKMMVPLIFDREEISLRDFLEAACSFGFFIASLLHSPFVKALKREEIITLEKIDQLQKENLIDGLEIETITDNESEENAGVLGELEKMYTDSLTGLKKREYFEDVIVPGLYDGDGHYQGSDPRFVFVIEMLNLMEINKSYGREMGNAVVKECARALNESVAAAGSSRDNVVLRYDGLFFVGFIHTGFLAEAVDIILYIMRKLGRVELIIEEKILTGIPVGAAIYQEHNSMKFSDTKNVLLSLLKVSKEAGAGNVVFVRNADYIISQRDYDSRGGIIEDLVTVLQ